jgi:hypothetical protein
MDIFTSRALAWRQALDEVVQASLDRIAASKRLLAETDPLLKPDTVLSAREAAARLRSHAAILSELEPHSRTPGEGAPVEDKSP